MHHCLQHTVANPGGRCVQTNPQHFQSLEDFHPRLADEPLCGILQGGFVGEFGVEVPSEAQVRRNWGKFYLGVQCRKWSFLQLADGRKRCEENGEILQTTLQ